MGRELYRSLHAQDIAPVATHEMMAIASIAQIDERIRQSWINMDRLKNDLASREADPSVPGKVIRRAGLD